MSIRYARGIASTLRYEKQKVELLHIAAMKRLLPTFDSVIDEAIALADAEFARVKALRTDGGEQPSYREDAWDENGAPYYRDMEDVKEVVINMLVVALYHLFEQQLDALCRRLNPKSMPPTGPAPSLRTMVGSLQVCGLNVSAFNCWLTIEELRLVANVIKHGEGRSSEELLRIRPEMFPRDSSFQPFIGLPLTGTGFHTYMPRFNAYFDAVLAFWDEMTEALCNLAPTSDPRTFDEK